MPQASCRLRLRQFLGKLSINLTYKRFVMRVKNLFGLLVEKRKYNVYHPLGVDKVIADLAKVVRCNLNVVDARREAPSSLESRIFKFSFTH